MTNLSPKPAFTMIELVFVVVVLGILAAVAIPRLQNDSRQEAADQILSDIRQTQHLALTDDVTNPTNSNWQKAFWRIQFYNMAAPTGLTYSIGSDKDLGGNLDLIESAIDPLSGKPIFGFRTWGNTEVSPKVFIGKKFGISSITFGGSCAGTQHVGFDHMGRPHKSFTASATPDYSTRLTTPCTIEFIHPNGNFTINIAPETGYAFIAGQENQ